MKIHVEQIQILDGILVYSNYFKFTDSEDEDGADYEYDFESIYNNTDGILSTIVRLYGTTGLLEIIKEFASGNPSNRSFETIEFEEGSDLKKMIDASWNVENNDVITPDQIINNDEAHDNLMPSDNIFLFKGMVDSLPVNEDLNVLKMLGVSESNVFGEEREVVENAIHNSGLSIGNGIKKLFKFNNSGFDKVVAVYDANFMIFTIVDDHVVLDFPDNPSQQKLYALMNKYARITNATMMKSKVLLELSFNGVALAETNEELKDQYILFDIASEKFISRENKLVV